MKKRHIQNFYKEKTVALIEKEEYEHAENFLKKFLHQEDLSSFDRSKIYELLGMLKFQTGDYSRSKRYYAIALKYNRKNSNALLNYGNILILENRFNDAAVLFNKYLKYQTHKKEIFRQLGSCYSFMGNISYAKFVFENILEKEGMDEQSIVDYAYCYVINKNFDYAKKILLKGLSKFPESFLLLDAYDEFSEIEETLKEVKKDILFPFMTTLSDKVYVRAATILAENMCIRGYFKFEMEKALDLLGSFADNGLKFKNAKLLAAICEFFTTLSISDEIFTINSVSSYYNLDKQVLKKQIRKLNLENSKIINEFLDELKTFYNYEIDKINDELEDFDE